MSLTMLANRRISKEFHDFVKRPTRPEEEEKERRRRRGGEEEEGGRRRKRRRRKKEEGGRRKKREEEEVPRPSLPRPRRFPSHRIVHRCPGPFTTAALRRPLVMPYCRRCRSITSSCGSSSGRVAVVVIVGVVGVVVTLLYICGWI